MRPKSSLKIPILTVFLSGGYFHWNMCSNVQKIYNWTRYNDARSTEEYFQFSLKVATKVFLEVKKLLKLRFLGYFLKVETRECDQEDWSVSNKFENITPCSAIYYLEVSAPFSLKAATKKIGVTVINSELLHFVQLHILKNCVLSFYWK